MLRVQQPYQNLCKVRMPELNFFSSEVEENVICTAVHSQESCPEVSSWQQRLNIHPKCVISALSSDGHKTTVSLG